MLCYYCLESNGEIQGEIERLEGASRCRTLPFEHDVIAAKINDLPPRSEPNQSIAELEDEITAIQTEPEATREALIAKRRMMEDIRQHIQEMILPEKDSETETQGLDPSRSTTPFLPTTGNENNQRLKRAMGRAMKLKAKTFRGRQHLRAIQLQP
ncbi:hypothetical protein BS47DRAFT_981297 [Hydnum rufescens UP504]|uniref:Uncharacterized protein n=1 Tax=Hydnum rufescens UP504 TaxID=1448309 RepID=A0A9P6AYS5_9AGAM|nr:hypothetical protein BS47DRAFT_981297 [Hydnum rufescens UP504]